MHAFNNKLNAYQRENESNVRKTYLQRYPVFPRHQRYVSGDIELGTTFFLR